MKGSTLDFIDVGGNRNGRLSFPPILILATHTFLFRYGEIFFEIEREAIFHVW